ncbi:hypothetical protein Mchl_4778 [Methylorubrum extorquens CM4]|uniref:Uncharacterized protein n=1 Tax=Methylorubrum extorquens (strain CM4 / NCIMB 13688) TaxID=440085 RepID=B7KRM5_METC4|nr:hypothetical protein Mchl_4778 [Methylorubrum extorquens CM4]
MRLSFSAGTTASYALSRSVPRFDGREPSWGERALDFSLCLILALAIVGLLLLAL